MNYTQSFDLAEFKHKVKQEIQNYQNHCLRYDSKVKEVIQKYQNDSQICNFSFDFYGKEIDLNKDLNDQLKPNTLEEALEQAKLLLEDPKIKKQICPVLNPAINKISEISDVIVPKLIGIVPLKPLLFVALAIIISKVGVNYICSNYSL